MNDFEDIKNNAACIVISRNEGIVYKRIQKNNRSRNKLMLVSDNPVFQPYAVNTEDILEMWQAQVVISKINNQQRWDMSQLTNIVSDLQEQVISLKRKLN